MDQLLYRYIKTYVGFISLRISLINNYSMINDQQFVDIFLMTKFSLKYAYGHTYYQRLFYLLYKICILSTIDLLSLLYYRLLQFIIISCIYLYIAVNVTMNTIVFHANDKIFFFIKFLIIFFVFVYFIFIQIWSKRMWTKYKHMIW